MVYTILIYIYAHERKSVIRRFASFFSGHGNYLALVALPPDILAGFEFRSGNRRAARVQEG